VVKANTLLKEKVSLQEVESTVHEILDSLSWAHEIVKVSGDEVDCFFQLKFVGPKEVAKGQAEKFLASQFADRKRKESFVSGLEGGENVRIFFDADKNPAQIKMEGATKRLAKDLDGKHSANKMAVLKDLGKILLDKTPLAKITVAEERLSIQINEVVAKKFSLDPEAISKDFDLRENVQWTSYS